MKAFLRNALQGVGPGGNLPRAVHLEHGRDYEEARRQDQGFLAR